MISLVQLLQKNPLIKGISTSRLHYGSFTALREGFCCEETLRGGSCGRAALGGRQAAGGQRQPGGTTGSRTSGEPHA
ncbi:Protein lin-28A [Manis javanica]|nr:Protein lin-28A [Manis javanica]